MLDELEKLNFNLASEFGYFDGIVPNWRVIWSDDELEKRFVTHTPEGLELLYKEVREIPKYRQWIHKKFVLERVLPIPEGVETDLVDKYSYEPVWVFQDSHGNPLPPNYGAIKLIVETVYNAARQAVGIKYKDPDSIPEDKKERELQRINTLQVELFGNETATTDSLMQQTGVSLHGPKFEYQGQDNPKEKEIVQ